MIQRKHLLTTSLTTNKSLGKKIFLGNWCITFQNENKISAKNINSYHWNKKKKLIDDYYYLKNLHNKLLKILSKNLNKILKVKYSQKFWLIYLGPWLNYYIQIIFDRWEILNKFQKKFGSNFITEKFIYNSDDFIFPSLQDFIKNVATDEFNHVIFNKIIDFKFGKNEKRYKFLNKSIKPLENSTNKKNFFFYIINFFNKLISPITKKQKILIYQSYLSTKEELILNFKFFQIPTFILPEFYINKKINYELRKKLSFKTNNKLNFENFLLDKINFFLPTEFLENFSEVRAKSKKIFFSTKPKIIFTSHAVNNYTLSKFYIADKVNEGSKLIYGQHGGVYGTDIFSTHEDFEKKISDIYLTWGWIDSKKCRDIGIIKPLNKILRKNSKISHNYSKLLYVFRSRSKFSLNLLHGDIRSSQMIKYFNENIRLIKFIKKEIQNKIILRLHSRKYGWDENKRFKSHFKKIKIDEGFSSITKLINESRLIVYTYNSTGYLETLAANIPTIIYFNYNDNPIRKSSKKYFQLLKENNIFFDDALKASKHINNIWNDIDDWWNNEKTQHARIKFCMNYARLNDNKLDDISQIIDQLK